MIIDNAFLELLPEVGESFNQQDIVHVPPRNLDDLYNFFNHISNNIGEGDSKSVFVSLLLHRMVSDKLVRLRKVTARVFEDIMAKLFNGQLADEAYRVNPVAPQEIIDLDKLCEDFDWNISRDLSGNKREKGDLVFGEGDTEYIISLKTQKGMLYEPGNTLLGNGLRITDRSQNLELNAGSLAFRALFIDLVDDALFWSLRDRRGGLGSRTQILRLYNHILERDDWENFRERMQLYLDYLYSDIDMMIAFKEGYRMTIHFIRGGDFVQAVMDAVRAGPSRIADLLHRWENNNIRLQLTHLFQLLRERDNLRTVQINFNEIPNNSDIIQVCEKCKETLIENIRRELTPEDG